MDVQWRIELLGGLCLRRPEASGPSEPRGRRFRLQKAATLLGYLALHPGRMVPRETLAALFWPEADPESGRASLRSALSSLRRQLEPPGIAAGTTLIAHRTAVGLKAAAIQTDVSAFEKATREAALPAGPSLTVRQVQLLEQALALYRGELLAGCYEDWALNERERLAEAFYRTAQRLIAHF